MAFLALPAEVIKLIINYLVGPSSDGVLDDQSLPRARDAYALCRNHSSLYNLFRTSFHSVFISYFSVVFANIDLAALARLFGASLRHVSIYLHPGEVLQEHRRMPGRWKVTPLHLQSALRGRLQATLFFDALAETQPKLESLSIDMTDNRGTFCPDSLITVLSHSRETLRALRISVLFFDFKKFAPLAAPFLCNLQALSLNNSASLTEKDLLIMLRSSGTKLEYLGLNRLSSASLTERSPSDIFSTCPQLGTFEISRMPYQFAVAVRDMSRAVILAPCNDVYWWKYSIECHRSEVLDSNFQRPTRFVQFIDRNEHPHVEIEEPPGPPTPTLTLHSLFLYDLRYFQAPDFRSTREAFPNLRELFLGSDCEQLYTESLLNMIGPQLQVLDIDGIFSPPSDTYLRAISKCTGLEELRVVFRWDDPLEWKKNREFDFTKDGLSQMLLLIGGNLRRFELASVTETSSLADAIGSPRLASASDIAECLSKYCENLKFVSIRGFTPALQAPLKDGVAINHVKKRNVGVAVYVDALLPFWFNADTRPRHDSTSGRETRCLFTKEWSR